MSVSYICDANVENCDAVGELVVRPDGGAFGSLIGIYLGEIISPILALGLGILIN